MLAAKVKHITETLTENKMQHSNYSRITLNQHPLDWAGAGLSNILEYPAVPILTKVLCC